MKNSFYWGEEIDTCKIKENAVGKKIQKSLENDIVHTVCMFFGVRRKEPDCTVGTGRSAGSTY